MYNANQTIPYSVPTKDELNHIHKLAMSNNDEDKQKATNAMVEYASPVIISIIKTKYFRYIPKYFDDLMQEGYLAVIFGMLVFDPEKDEFEPFFTKWIDHYVGKKCQEFDDLKPMRFRPSAKQLVKNSVKRRKANGQEISIDAICEDTMLTRTVVIMAIRIISKEAATTNKEE